MKRGNQKKAQNDRKENKYEASNKHKYADKAMEELVATSTRLDHDNYNFFRTARAQTELDDSLLFHEQPRQLLFLVLVVLVISYYTFTHDSDVGHSYCWI